MEFIKGRRAIVLLNKTDLEMAIDKKELEKRMLESDLIRQTNKNRKDKSRF